MAIQGVETKCYILALFVRDDDERFLLGSGHYEFKDSQKQFSANTIQNDVVEVQGNDGFLLAGQVRRPGTQSFDGYIGDGTTEKTEVEEYRRKFFGFFRKNHFYRVIYVFPDGSAIQRKRGFLVDDATVQELYQQYPEYHVALNFEDVNYYSYSENEQGEEIYAEEAQIDLSSMLATGGLVWDEYGAVNQGYAWGGEVTASGTEFTVQNDLSLPALISDARLNGNIFQQTYSGKNLLPPPEDFTQDVNGLTITCSNGEYTFSGNASSGSSTGLKTTIAQYTIREGDYFHYNNSLVSNRINIGLRFSDNTQFANSMNVKNRIISLANYVGKTVVGVNVNFNSGYDFSGTAKPMILNGVSTVTPFEPYVGGVPAPNPDYPQEIHTVTGEQTVRVSDGVNSQSYPISLGSTELCKIGDYQDYIYKGADGWYVHKEIGKAELGTLNWNASATNQTGIYRMVTRGLEYSFVAPTANNIPMSAVSSHFIAVPADPSGTYGAHTGVNAPASGRDIYIYNKDYNTSTSATDFKTWLANNNVVLYYALATPTDTKITDTTLSSQLDALGSAKLMVGENNVLVSATSTNLPAELQIKYYSTVSFDGAGFVWEEGGSGGPTTVEINSITNVYPIWKVKGPAVNPELSVITTNTTLKYEGSVGANQTLVIDMMNKTAKINGTSVIGNVTGDWVNFTPGINRVVYITDNADTPPSLIEWQEVVG